MYFYFWWITTYYFIIINNFYYFLCCIPVMIRLNTYMLLLVCIEKPFVIIIRFSILLSIDVVLTLQQNNRLVFILCGAVSIKKMKSYNSPLNYYLSPCRSTQIQMLSVVPFYSAQINCLTIFFPGSNRRMRGIWWRQCLNMNLYLFRLT